MPAPTQPVPTPLEIETDKLIQWCETNSADATDLHEALSLAGVRLGRRRDLARANEIETIKTFVASERTKGGKTPIVPDKAEAP